MNTIPILRGKRITVGVCGSIAAYKVVGLVSALHQAGATVDVAMTSAAQRFVAPLSFQSLTHRPVLADLWAPGAETDIAHVTLGRESDAVVIAPVTANMLAKLALGLADDPVSVTALAARGPLLVAPAMDAGMYDHPATAENLARLRARGVTVVEPEQGHLASGLSGLGRLATIEALMDAIRTVLGRGGDLAGRSILVTAGGTQEPIDPVRYITNRSSGKMGYALAEAARDRGAVVTLITAPTALRPPDGVEVLPISRAVEMLEVLRGRYPAADALIMAAAVADFHLAQVAGRKLKRSGAALSLVLEPNPDLLLETSGWTVEHHPVRVGFAAETEELVTNAQAKLDRKRLDLIAANDVTSEGSGFGTETNTVTLLWADGRRLQLPLLPKIEVANRVLDAVLELLPLR